MLSDFSLILYWWFLLFVLGIVFFPTAFLFFRQFFDRGYSFSKIIALLCLSYAVWFLGSLKILPFMPEVIWLLVIAAAGFNLWLFRRTKNFKKTIKKTWKIILFEESLFLLALAFWAFVRGFQPDIHGLEKFMDFGFVNSILRSKYFPPADMWLAGETINYYYFGHLMTAVLTKLASLDAAVTYNLMIAALFAFTFTAGFSLGANLAFLVSPEKGWTRLKSIIFKKPRLKLVFSAGLMAAFLLSLGSNSHPLYWFLKNGHFQNYWYPDATRFIVEKFGAQDNTIHEFPIYSFVVADLHGHLLNLPLVLLFMALIISFLFKSSLPWLRLTSAAFLLSVFYMTNAWDLAVYLLALGMVVLWFNYLKWNLKPKMILQAFFQLGFVLLMIILFSLPFQLHFESIAAGIGLVDFRSPPWMLFVLWGFPFFLTLSVLSWLRKTQNFFHRPQPKPEVLVFLFLILAWALVLIPEFIFLKDIYIHSHQRANTMFKLTYQAFVLFAVSAPFIFLKTLFALKSKPARLFFLSLVLGFSFFLFRYPFMAVNSYYGLKNYQGLNGQAYLRKTYPDDYQTILWLQDNLKGQPVIAEAVGDSYTDFARISANTGLPAILGWRVHEWLWRGSFDEAGKRTEEVKTIYESPDLAKTNKLLQKYRVKYLILGLLERKQYPQLQERKFYQLGKVIYSSGTTRVYQFNN